MRKGLIIGAYFLFILIVLMSVVSAGFFSNWWGKITGKATYPQYGTCEECAQQQHYSWCTADGGSCRDENDNAYCENLGGFLIDNENECPVCGNGICEDTKGETAASCPNDCGPCTDDDFGLDYSIAGSVSKGTITKNDVCYTNPSEGIYGELRESYCGDNEQIAYKIFDCPCCTGSPLPENCVEYATCPTNYACDEITGICSEISIICGDEVTNIGEECDDGNNNDNDGCSSECLLEFCGDNIINNVSEECDDGNTVNTDDCANDCTIPPACVNNKQDYPLTGLNVNSECGVEFTSDVITSSLSTLGKTAFAVKNETVRKILNITVNETVSSATLDFTLDEDDFRFLVDELLIYIEDVDSLGWTLLDQVSVSLKSGSLYTYTVSAPHFSLFLIVEPDYCGNGIFESNYHEDCDGSTHCTACVCDRGYDKDGSGNCIEEITGASCSPVGNETCTGYTLYECGIDLEWDNKGIVVGNCSVECLSGEKDCNGEISLLCASNYVWITQGKISGQCGYVFSGTGNGYDEGEEGGEQGEGFIAQLLERKGLLVLFIVLGIVLLFIVFRFMKSSRGIEETSHVATSKTVSPSSYPEQKYL